MPMIQEQLQAQIASAVGGRAFPHRAPLGVASPYLTYFRASARPNNTLSGAPGTRNTRFQIDIYAPRYADASSAAEAVKAALQAWSLANVVNAEIDLFEDTASEHRILLDISVWS